MRTRRGKIFTPSTVRGILINEAYIGNLIWNKQDKKTKGVKFKDKKYWVRKEGVLPPIIDREVFNAIQKSFEQNRIDHSPKSVGRTHILSGLVKCGICGNNYVFQASQRKSEDTVYRNEYYKCSLKQKLGSKYCDNVVLKADQFEEAITNIVLEKIYSKENIVKIFELYKRDYEKSVKEVKSNRNIYATELKDVKEKIGNILKAIEKGFGEDDFRERLNELKKRQEELTQKLSKGKDNVEFNYTLEDIESFAKMIKDLIPQLPPEKMNKLFKLFLKEIVVYPDRCEIFYTFDFKKSENKSDGSNGNGDLSNSEKDLEIKIEGFSPISLDPVRNISRGYEWCRGLVQIQNDDKLILFTERKCKRF